MSHLPAFQVMIKPRGALCNLNCAYCYFLEKTSLYPGSSFTMSDELLEEFTRQYIEAQRGPEVTFAWQGGEPTLMGLDFYHKAIRYQKKYRRQGLSIQNTIQTNGVTLDDEWASFFRKPRFLVGISLDGPQALHDTYRVDKGGQPTFDKVLQGLEHLRRYSVPFNVLTTVNAANQQHPLEVYRFLRDEVRARFIQFIPIVERLDDAEPDQVTERSVGGEQYGIFLIEIFDEWVRRDVGKVFVQIFDVALGVWCGHPASLCVFGQTCGQGLALEHNGDLYACDHFVAPAYKLGNLSQSSLAEMVNSPQQRRFGLAKRTSLTAACRKCPVVFICNGGCPKDRFLTTQEGEKGLNYLCQGYQAFFQHIDQPMKAMSWLIAQGRPPAEIMRKAPHTSAQY